MSNSQNHDHLLWSEVEAKTLLDARIFTIRSSRRRAADGKEASFVLVDSADWCNVIAPVTAGDRTPCFVLARQYRHGGQVLTLEFPGGLVDPGEEPETAARRELEEETGYHAGGLTLIGATNPNPAFMSNTVYTYLAADVSLVTDQRLDENERVDVELVPIDDIVSLARPGFRAHAIMLAALYWYKLYKNDGLDYESRARG